MYVDDDNNVRFGFFFFSGVKLLVLSSKKMKVKSRSQIHLHYKCVLLVVSLCGLHCAE